VNQMAAGTVGRRKRSACAKWRRSANTLEQATQPPVNANVGRYRPAFSRPTPCNLGVLAYASFRESRHASSRSMKMCGEKPLPAETVPSEDLACQPYLVQFPQ
jgi:hypothetical protein